MEMKVQPNNKRGRGARPARLLVLLLLVSALFIPGRTVVPDVLAAEDDRTCTITVSFPSDDDIYNELAGASVTLDFYKIADAEKADDEEFYIFGDWDKAFSAQQTMWEEILENVEEGSYPSAEEINALGQSLAAAVFEDGAVKPYTFPVEGTVPVPGKALTVEPGFYMIIPHDGSISKEAYIVKTETGSGAAPSYSTIVKGQEKTYHFAPILVSVPIRGETELQGSVAVPSDPVSIDAPAGIDDTLTGSEWTFDIKVVTKTAVELPTPTPTPTPAEPTPTPDEPTPTPVQPTVTPGEPTPTPTTPGPPPKRPPKEPPETVKTPKSGIFTGDSSPVFYYVVLMDVAALIFIILLVNRRRRRKDSD